MKLNFLCLLLTLFVSLPTHIWSSPVRVERNADGAACSSDGLYAYSSTQEYVYGYRSNTTLWINDVSDEAKSNVELTADVVLQLVMPCYYQLKLQNVNLVGATVQNVQSVAAELTRNVVLVTILPNGAILTDSVKFGGDEQLWARNVKRAIISSLQLRYDADLRSDDTQPNVKSSIVYETDSLGKARTTYKLRRVDANTLKFEKSKALHRSSLDEYTSSPVQTVPYKSIAEYFPGRLYIESHECDAEVKNGVIQQVECKHKSTYRMGSHGDNGVQAIARQELTLKSQRAAAPAQPALDRAAALSIVHEYTDLENDNAAAFDPSAYLNDLCNVVSVSGLNNQHAQQFRNLVNSLRQKSRVELLGLIGQASKICKLAAKAAVSATVFSETDASIEAVLALMDQDALSETLVITEYPALTALARNRNPSKELVNKLRAYLASKDAKFPYLRKLYLVYSSLVNRYCDQNRCSNADLNQWTGLLAANLGSNCLDSSNADLVVASLKAIGNVGYLENTNVLENCAQEKGNSLETRVSAIEALRRFPCEKKQNLNGNYAILKDTSDDSEVRIKAFLSLVQCVNSEKFQTFAANDYSDLLVADNDLQVVSFIVDYGKEHGVTVLLNPVLSDPAIKEKLQTNFKEFSWNSFRYRYSVVRDSAIEVDTSVVYTPKTFLPRSINFNLTAHVLGFSVNGLDATLRLEGLDEILKVLVNDKLRGDEFLKRLMERPEQLLPVLQSLADKLKYTGERQYVSLSIRIYGSEVFFSQLNKPEQFKQVTEYLRNLRSAVYTKKEVLRNLFLIDNYNKKPLANGFEFGSSIDVAASLHHSRDGSKTGSDDQVQFNFKILNSASFALQRQFNVQLNGENKLSLRKNVNGNARLHLVADGSRQKGQAVYNLNLSPDQEVTLFQLEGKFSKLDANSQFTPVTNFKTEQLQWDRCSSDNFQKNVGLNVCASIKRPELRRLRDILKNIEDNQLNFGDDDEDDDLLDDDDDEGAGLGDGIERPKISLAGPYRYQLSLKNPNGIRKLTVNAKWVKDDDNKDCQGSISSTDANNVRRQLDISYTRNRKTTSRQLTRNFELLIKGSGTQDVRFRLGGGIEYKRKELLSVSFELNNKMLRDYHVLLNFNRTHNPDHLAGSYNLEARYNSNVFERKHHHLLWTVASQEKQLHSHLHVDSLLPQAAASGKLARLVHAHLKLDPRNIDSADPDYDVSLKGETITGKQANLAGVYKRSILESLLDLTGTYSSPNVQPARSVQVRAGHNYGGEQAPSSVHFDLTAPRLGISHGFKLSAEMSRGKRAHLQLELNTPATKAANSPLTVFYTRNDGENQDDATFGFRNSNVDLTQRTSNLAKTLARADGDEILRSFVVEVKRVQQAQRTESSFEVRKNDNVIASANVYRQGDVSALRNGNINELPEQKVSVGGSFALLEYQGGLTADLTLANSVSAKTRAYLLNLKAENLFKTLLRLSDLSLRSKLNDGVIDFNLKINREASQYKSLELTANGPIRSAANGDIEFDLKYNKVFNDGSNKQANGVVSYKLDDLKNFRASMDIPSVFNFKTNLQNQRAADQLVGRHAAQLSYAYLDNAEPEKRNMEFLLEKKALGNGLSSFAVVAKDDISAVVGESRYNLDFSLNQVWAQGRQLVAHSDSLKLVSKRLSANVDSRHSFKVDVQNKKMIVESSTEARLPALISKTAPTVSFKRTINAEASLDFKQVKWSQTLDTDSKVFGRLVRFLNLEYSHQLQPAVGRVVAAKLNADYKLGSDKTGQLKSLNVALTLDGCRDAPVCFNVNVNSKRDGRDCVTQAKLQRDNSVLRSSESARLFVGLDVKCNNVQITQTQLLLQRQIEAEHTRRVFELSSKSDVYEQKKLRMAFGPLNRQAGNAELHVYLNNAKFAEYAVEYTRDKNYETRKLNSANWKFSAKLGANTQKTCTLNIKRDVDYRNALSCTLNMDSTPYTYGYSVVLFNREQIMFGQRHAEVDLILPVGRQLRVEYKASRASPIDNTDDDDDPNDEREFNATANLYWDYSRDKNRALTVQLKRDNYAKGKFRFFADVSSADGRKLRLDYDHVRAFNETQMGVSVSYDLKNNVKNQLDVSAKLSSDLQENRFQYEVNLQRPSFNVQYSNEYNKYTGRLNVLNVRVANLLNLRVDKEHDPNRRRISLELLKSSSLYQADVSSTYNDQTDSYHVKSVLSRNGQKQSEINSVFNSQLVNLNVNIAAKSNYVFDFGLLSEKLGNGYLKRNNEVVALGRVSVKKVPIREDFNLHELVLDLQWNRFWHQLQSDVLGVESDSAQANAKTNSYLGDTYAQVAQDLRPVVEALRAQRLLIRQDLAKSLGLLLKYYSNYTPLAYQLQMKLAALQQKAEAEQAAYVPLHLRIAQRYNALSQCFDDLVRRLHSTRFARLAKYVPRLPRFAYNRNEANQYKNNLVISRGTRRATNLYQANAELRDRVRRLGSLVLFVKRTLVRDIKSLGVRALINKYKYRSVASGYTIVGSVYNRRNIIGFDGESAVLLSRCTYLLAHETAKNRFTVLLNFNDKAAVLSLYLYGKGPFNLAANGVSLGDQALVTPADYALPNGERIEVDRTNDATCVQVVGEIKACCYEDTNSCTVAVSRWYTGKVNGLLGKSDNLPEKILPNQWGLDCKHYTGLMRPNSDEAVRTCYATFGRHRRSLLKDAVLAVNPNGWRKVCESALTVDKNNFCPLVRAFAAHARLKSVRVNVPESCYQCKNSANGKSYKVGQRVTAAEAHKSNLEAGSDIVFLSLGCGKTSLVDYSKFASVVRQANSNNKYYLVRIDGDQVSVHQSTNGDLSNFNVDDAVKNANQLSSGRPSEDAFEQAVFYAKSLFARRTASARHLAIISCGNCLKYRLRTVRRLTKQLLESNVFVTSFGQYNIKDEASDDQIVGYDENQVVILRDNAVETDDIASYKLEHEGDVCHRLAVKTHGAVFNLASLKNVVVFKHVAGLFARHNSRHTFNLNTCSVVRGPYGAYADFKFNNVHKHFTSAASDEDSLDN